METWFCPTIEMKVVLHDKVFIWSQVPKIFQHNAPSTNKRSDDDKRFAESIKELEELKYKQYGKKTVPYQGAPENFSDPYNSALLQQSKINSQSLGGVYLVENNYINLLDSNPSNYSIRDLKKMVDIIINKKRRTSFFKTRTSNFR